ncbi:MAG: hypothetical protein CFE33_02430 [Pseudorhodobacter sp. PARRP1]|nr:MAG: hypothetical protein CFE33_02430 [Pseudorhodobacter sp. PARRP1]
MQSDPLLEIQHAEHDAEISETPPPPKSKLRRTLALIGQSFAACVVLLVAIIAVPFKLAMRLSKPLLAVIAVIFFVLSVSLPIATTLSSGIFYFASSIAGLITTVPDLLKRKTVTTETKLAEKEAALVAERAARQQATKAAQKIETKLVASETALVAERSARKVAENGTLKVAAELDAATTRAAIAQVKSIGLAKKLAASEAELFAKAEARLLYRGEKTLINEIVADTAKRINTRMAAMMKSDIGGMVGQAIPYIGTAAIVGVTAYDLNASCEMMKDLHAMDVAFNPEHAIDSREVCGMRVPTVEEVADAAWKSATETGHAAYDWTTGFFR